MPEDARQSLGEIYQEVEKEILNESEAPSPSEEELQEQKQVEEDLQKDEEFKQSEDQFKGLNQDKRFRKLYWERSQAKRDAEARAKELEDLKSQLEELRKVPELDDNRLQEYAKSRGYQLTRAQQEAKDAKAKAVQDLIQMAQTPEERQWWEQFTAAQQKEILDKIQGQYGEQLKPFQKGGEFYEDMVDFRIDKQETNAKKHIASMNEKYGVEIDYDKDIYPEIEKRILNSRGQINRYNADIMGLTREILADKGIELGKQLSERQQRKLLEEKKKANIETPGVAQPSEKDWGSMRPGKIFEETLKELSPMQ